MTNQTNTTLADLMPAYEAERAAEIERDEARRNTPEARAKNVAKVKEEHERGVRLGWWDEQGDPLELPSDDDADLDEQDGDL